MQPSRIAVIPVLSDNYVFVLHDGRRAVVVDPAVAGPVIRWLAERRLEPVAVLHTHHHADHIGGTPGLLRRWPGCAVIAARSDRRRIPLQTVGVGEGDRFELLGRAVEVLEVPGHTRAHIAFHLPGVDGGPGDLFCGDTLFAGGCGRLFEGTPEQMHASLGRLAALPPDTRVWCAHEYTETNLRWAAAQAPADTAIARRLAAVRRERAAGRFTIPSSIGEERATNLFLRAGDAGELALLRESRNRW
jgi:hydroxyacylglutathione hydrolase